MLNHILTAKHGQRIAVIENEFGAVGIDDKLLQQNMKEYTENAIIETLNGCICCNVRGDLIATLEKLAERVYGGGGLQLDAVIIETTGMADPSPVAQTFFADEVRLCSARYMIVSIVSLVATCQQFHFLRIWLTFLDAFTATPSCPNSLR